jgi:hypothetical protein
MQFLLDPTILWPLIFEAAIGCIVGACSRRAGWRILTWVIVPMIIAVIGAGDLGLFTESGESRGWALLYFMYLAPSGYVVCGAGVLFGYFLRRAITSRTVHT